MTLPVKNPLNEKVRLYIEEQIDKNGFPEGKLPNERVLAAQLAVSRGTLRVALEELEANGVITRYRNKGTFLKNFQKIEASFNKNLILIFAKGFSQQGIVSASSFYGEVYFSILHEASRLKYSLVTLIPEENGEDVILEKCKNMNVDGFIFIADHSLKFIEQFKKFKKPLLIFDHSIKNSGISSININSYQGSFLAVKYLYEHGHRKIGFLNHIRWQKINPERGNGYFDGLKYCGLEAKEEYHRLCKPDAKSGADVIAELLKLKEPPTALLCFDTYLALGVYSACMKMGIKVPSQLSIIAFRGYPTGHAYSLVNTIDAIDANIGKIILDEIFYDHGLSDKPYRDSLIDLKITDNGSCERIKT